MYAVTGKPNRRAVRRAVRTRCQAVGASDFELLGSHILDLSPCGMLVACDLPVALGEEVIVSFETPGDQDYWLDAEAEIARIVQGYRTGDPGYCIGLRFTYFERSSRGELLSSLCGLPPPIPQRRPPRREPVAGVQTRSILSVSSVFRGLPSGVFTA
jgi:hypothetical protein